MTRFKLSNILMFLFFIAENVKIFLTGITIADINLTLLAIFTALFIKTMEVRQN